MLSINFSVSSIHRQGYVIKEARQGIHYLLEKMKPGFENRWIRVLDHISIYRIGGPRSMYRWNWYSRWKSVLEVAQDYSS